MANELNQLRAEVAGIKAILRNGVQPRIDRIEERLHNVEGKTNHLEGGTGKVSTKTMWAAIGSLAVVGSLVVTLVVGLT